MITFYTGGARSGKSTAAQNLAIKLSQAHNKEVIYVATGLNIDEEMNLRIKKHQEDRPKDFITKECPYNIHHHLKEENCIYIIDCITIYITNLMFKIKDNWENTEVLSFEEQQEIEGAVSKNILELIGAMQSINADFIVVSNELGMGLVPPYAFGRIFRDVAGQSNRLIANVAQEVYLCVSGIEVKIK